MESVPSAAVQLMITIIPIVGIVVAGVLVFAFLRWNHQQRMALIARGMVPQPFIDLGRFSLLLGLLSVAVGAVLTAVVLVVGGAGYAILGGLIPLAAGVAFLVFHRLSEGPAER